MSEAEARQHKAALIIQRTVRGFLGRKHAGAERKRKAEYEAQILKQERQAWAYLVKKEREEDERRQAVEREKLRKIKEQRAREHELREAAFEGDVDGMRRVLGFEGMNVDCVDANGETPLLEAAGGGQVRSFPPLHDCYDLFSLFH